MITFPPRSCSRRAMSLLEIMIALSVLAVGLLVSVSGFATLNSTRRMAKELVVATALANAVAERFQGVRYSTLSSTAAPWSMERSEPGTGVAAPRGPLVDDSDSASFLALGDTPADRGLQTLGIYPTSTGVDRLRVYVEYYRGTRALKDDGTPDPALPGLMSGEDTTSTYTTAEAFNIRFLFTFRQENIPAASLADVITNRNAYRVDPTSASDTDTIVMRILVTWGSNQQLSILTARGQ